jgi:hypothetical protein
LSAVAGHLVSLGRGAAWVLRLIQAAGCDGLGGFFRIYRVIGAWPLAQWATADLDRYLDPSADHLEPGCRLQSILAGLVAAGG